MRETAVIVHRARVPCVVYARSAIIHRFRSSFPVFFRFSRASALSRLGYARNISAILFLPFSSRRDLRNSFPREFPRVSLIESRTFQRRIQRGQAGSRAAGENLNRPAIEFLRGT